MTKITVLNQDGSTNGDIELNEAVFGVEPNDTVVFEAIVMQQASQRQGTQSTKTRTEVRGGGRKPWRQKGTGRARVGSTRSPIWVGGGVALGPKPRSYKYNLNKKQRRIAVTSVLSQKVIDDALIVVEGLSFEVPKTKAFADVLANLDVDSKVLVVLEASNNNAYLSARNIPNVKVIDDQNINVLDVVHADKVIFTKEALATVEEALA